MDDHSQRPAAQLPDTRDGVPLHQHRRRLAVWVTTVALVAGVLSASSPAGATVFPDVADDHPFALPIEWAVTAGVTSGYDDGTFRPTVPVSRQALAAFLARYDDGGSGSEPEACEGEGPFTDVPVSHPFCAEITWLVALGITTGFDDGTFRPTDPISRQAAAAFLTRYAADDEPAACPGDGPFSDVPVGHPFCAEITWMVSEGITTGFDDNTFRPTTPISRQAAAAFLWRLAGEPAGLTQLASVAADGTQGTQHTFSSALSADRSTVAFISNAPELVPQGSIGFAQVYVRDIATGVIERVSVSSDGDEGNRNSQAVVLSADGSVVAFESSATNLVPGDDNEENDIFVHDRSTGTTERVSVGSAGDEADGRSRTPVLSADGSVVAFASEATNLVSGDDNEENDIFVHDRETGTTERVSVTTAGLEGDAFSSQPAISGDGRLVAFRSQSDLTDEETPFAAVFVHDRQAGTTTLGSPTIDGEPATGPATNPSLSSDGRFLLFASSATNHGPGGTPGLFDLWVRDRQADTVELVSVTHDGAPADQSTSNGHLSSDGRFVAFTTGASNLLPGEPPVAAEVYLRDRQSGVTELVSVGVDGAKGDGDAVAGAQVSDDGRVVAFVSNATNLVPNDTNGRRDAFLRFRLGTG